ncbi:MAG TPA: RIP metalloprotease RseP [bacterium]|nr:RIP metalloprotease RseP [bacterium]
MMMDTFTSVFTNLFYFAIVLGLAVIFHEWGHFIVAKLCGARVDEFAVGFGKKLFRYTWHETEYSVRLLPLGGLVKIRGMDPDEDLTGADFEYLQLAPWKRILIVVAGPFMNFVLAYLLYVFVLLAFGETYNATTTVGYVPMGSMGWEMGIRKDDKILSVNGVPVSSWDEIASLQSDMARETLVLTLERDGQILTKEKKIPPNYSQSGEREEVTPPTTFEGIFVSSVLPDGPAAKAGLPSGVEIISVDGKTFATRDQWSEYISSRYTQTPEGDYHAEPITLVYKEPQGATRSLTVTPDLIFPAPDADPYRPKTQLALTFQGEMSMEEYLTPSTPPLGIAPKLNPVVGKVQEGSPAGLAGLTEDSRIIEMNGQPVNNWIDVLRTIYSVPVTAVNGEYKADPIQVTWLSPEGEMRQASITPRVTLQNVLTPTGAKTGKRYPLPQLGIDMKMDRKQIGVLGAATYGFEKVIQVCGFMVDFLHKLFTGDISPKLLGGPIAIYQLSGESGRWGWERFFSFIALLSVNLALLNLFPFPPFDGGHAVVYLVEMVRMKPMTMKQMETFGKIGFVLIIPLFIYLIFNDLSRTDLFTWLKGLIIAKS